MSNERSSPPSTTQQTFNPLFEASQRFDRKEGKNISEAMIAKRRRRKLFSLLAKHERQSISPPQKPSLKEHSFKMEVTHFSSHFSMLLAFKHKIIEKKIGGTWNMSGTDAGREVFVSAAIVRSGPKDVLVTHHLPGSRVQWKSDKKKKKEPIRTKHKTYICMMIMPCCCSADVVFLSSLLHFFLASRSVPSDLFGCFSLSFFETFFSVSFWTCGN